MKPQLLRKSKRQLKSDLVIVIDNARAILIGLGDTVLLRKIVFLGLAVGVEVRALGLTADTNSVAAVRAESVGGRMVGDAVVPKGNVILVPLEASVNLRGGGDNLVEKRDDVVTFSLGDTNNLRHETWVEEEGLPPGHRVSADQRMLGGDGVPAYRAAKVTRALRLHLGRMDSSQALKVLLHVWRQHIVGGVLAGPEGVTTTSTGWASQDLERSVGRRLNFVGDLRMSVKSGMSSVEMLTSECHRKVGAKSARRSGESSPV